MDESNNHLIGKSSNHTTKLHEHDFMLTRNEEAQTSIIICCICDLVYCEKCGKLIMICGKSYMQKNVYN
jgi:hypothetical protein